MPHPLDELAIHQVPLSMRYVQTSDRNAYDRCIYHAIDTVDGTMLATGLGLYPNLGVIDAYVSVRRGDRQFTVRASDALGESRDQAVGPFRIEVLEPLKKLRLTCDGDEHGVGFDLVYDGAVPAFDEPHHVNRTRDRVTIDGCRFCQTGAWTGTIRVDGETLDVTPDRWTGTRDRSWGIRGVGEPDPPGRNADEPVMEGFWWCWSPLKFADFTIFVIAQEDPSGRRMLEDALRIWPDGRVESLGRPEFAVAYRSGTRHPESAVIRTSAGPVIEVEVRPGVSLNVGCGYGGDPDWAHGQWRGRGYVSGSVYDYTDPAVAGRAAFSVVDHVGRATLDGAVGWGVFEHGTFGRHDPTGFADWSSVAP